MIGVGAAVLSLALALALGRTLEDRQHRAASRTPVVADGTTAGAFRFAVRSDRYRGRPLQRVLMTTTDVGWARNNAPVGLDNAPQPGKAAASPALIQALREDSALAARLGAVVSTTIGANGLLAPDELFAYVGLTPEQAPPDAAPGSGFSVATGPDVSGSKTVRAELVLLIVLPTLLYLSIVARLSARTRVQRMASLRRLGASRLVVVLSGGAEGAVAGACGASLGAVTYSLVQPLIATSGVLGFSWYPSSTHVGVPTLVALVLGTTLFLSVAGALGARHALQRPTDFRHAVAVSRVRFFVLRVIPLVVGVGVLAGVTVRSAHGRLAGTVGTNLSALGTVLVTVGLILVVGPLVVILGRQLRRSQRLAAHLAGAQLVDEPSSMVRVATGLVAIVVVGTGLVAALADLRSVTGVNASTITVRVEGTELTLAQRAQVGTLPGPVLPVSRSQIVPLRRPARTPAEDLQSNGVGVVTASCSALRLMLRQPLPECADGRAFRVRSADGDASVQPPLEPVGYELHFDGADGAVAVPRAVLTVEHLATSGLSRVVILTRSAAPLLSGWPVATSFDFVVPADGRALDRLLDRLAAVAPTAAIALPSVNLEQLDNYELQRGVLAFAFAAGALVALLGLASGLIDRALERRPVVASLAVVEASAGLLRRTQLIQVLVPLTAVAAMAVAVSCLAATS